MTHRCLARWACELSFGRVTDWRRGSSAEVGKPDSREPWARQQRVLGPSGQRRLPKRVKLTVVF